MQAVIFADRHGAELAPLCGQRCPALLDLANRPLVQYTVEDLARAGVTEILLVVSDDATALQALLGDGAMWGVGIRYLLSRGEESPRRLLARFAALLRPPFLAARGDVLRTMAVARLLAAAEAVSGPVVGATLGGTPVGLCLVRQWPAELTGLAWPLPAAPAPDAAVVEIGAGTFAALDSLADFHRASLALAAFDPAQPVPPGVALAAGLRVDRLAQVTPENREAGDVVVGARTWVHRSARLTGPCVVGRDCYIDRAVRIRDSVVMPGSYVGEGLEVEHAIVAGGTLIRVDLGIQIEIGEAKLLADNGSELGEAIRQWPERLIAAALVVLSLPLWPLALLAAFAASPRAPLSRRRILGNRYRGSGEDRQRQAVDAWEFDTPIPLLRHLPKLWLVARGDLRLFGARPMVATAAAGRVSPPRGRQGEGATAGLLGPAQLFLPVDAPEEEIHLCEREFVTHRSLTTLWRRLGAAARLLLSARAWRRAQKALADA